MLGFHGINSFDTMKTSTVLTSASIAALVAFVLSSASFEAAVSLFATAGFAAIAIGDYSRKARSLTGRLSPAGVAADRTERLGLAA